MAVLGALLILLILWDTFETIVIPKLVERRVRLSTIYYRFVWQVWHFVTDRLPAGQLRASALMSFGALCIIFLFAVWGTVLIVGFGLVHMGIGDLGFAANFRQYLYYSGVTFFTLGYGDMVARSSLGQLVSVAEAGTGFGFLAIVISYIPILYQAFSKREHFIIKMDSRFGSVPSAGVALRRFGGESAMSSMREFLKDAEQWSSEQLEGYLSYPILAFYRSQHETQSWLSAMTAVLDLCALVMAGADPLEDWEHDLVFQAKATFAMSRHVIVDLSYVFEDPPAEHAPGRLTQEERGRLLRRLEGAFGSVRSDFNERLDEFQAMYEPYLIGLARDLHFVLPSWTEGADAIDNWQQTAWDGSAHF
ncbi:MAG TPA: potassium channel family protein [Fimbriimonadaceae bacterium]|nr:potassium channel family protein [Fimbriimonadaceae bacterium]